MKGIIFNIVEDVVSDNLGEAVWDQLLIDAGVDHTHTSLGNYDDAELVALVMAAAAALDKSPRDVMCWVGEGAVVHFFNRYPHYFENHHSTRTFLPTLDRIIHPEVRKLYSEVRPPSFECGTADNGDMTVVYASHRAMCGLAEGLMYGLAGFFGESVAIGHPECAENNGKQCRFQLHFS